MVMLIVPQLPEKVFRKIVEILPTPSSVEVELFGNFDYTPIYKQVRQLLPEAELDWQGGHVYHLKNPQKEIILKLYQAPVPSQKEPTSQSGRLSGAVEKSVSIKKIEWWLEDANIRLTPWELEIEYTGKEPGYVAELREAIALPEVVVQVKALMRAH